MMSTESIFVDTRIMELKAFSYGLGKKIITHCPQTSNRKQLFNILSQLCERNKNKVMWK